MKLCYVILLSAVGLVLSQPQNYDDYPYMFGNTNNYDYYPAVSQQVLQTQTSGPGQTVVEFQTEPTEPGPLDCREEQYPCTRLYSVHQPCKQCLNSICFYSLRRVYVINKEICVRTVCAHEELLRADLCRDQFSRCGVVALSGQCGSMGGNCAKSCGSC
ncbi:microfibrillar-associated protein 2 [Misgurnus anguillicaudatus]|uniref:microfibrillar-associated protein 2 n=1 Tax=Misgurnus anguillicaudatus TaxID=75329 RepID=UPI00243551A9|nr:microfibrillar-associated protein 2 [Misgurnus anguillicaudatus]